MLGPSDFRKNLSYLFGNYSQAQYALKNLMEYRLAGAQRDREAGAASPAAATPSAGRAAGRLVRATAAGDAASGCAGCCRASSPMPPAADFDYRDCSLGNLVFAGAYLQHGEDFNAAAAEVAIWSAAAPGC